MIVATVSVAAQMATDGGNSAPVIRALEHAWFDGEARNDNRALDLIFDNALVYIEYGKVMTKGEYLARVKAVTPQPQQVAMESMTVRTFNGTAIVVGIYREKGVTDGKTFLRRWRFVDTWVNKKGRWMLVAAASSPMPK